MCLFSLPRQMATRLWFGVDDTASTVWFPAYGGMTRIPFSFSDVRGRRIHLCAVVG
jgi:hypothetical protein